LKDEGGAEFELDVEADAPPAEVGVRISILQNVAELVWVWSFLMLSS